MSSSIIAQAEITQAVKTLQQGGLVAFPTETVYGLGADASNPDALNTLYQLKGRPEKHPVIVHIAKIEELGAWAVEIPGTALKLAQAFWPGPLTLILKKAPHVLPQVTGGQNTIGLRVPNHPTALALLNAFGSGIAAPSANRFGALSPTRAIQVDPGFREKGVLVLDGPSPDVGIESTIVDCTCNPVRVLRPGMITVEQIEAVLAQSADRTELKEKTAIPRVSGQYLKHYAPRTPLFLRSSADLDRLSLDSPTQHGIGLVRYTQPSFQPNNPLVRLLPALPTGYARDLYQTLFELDTMGLQEIWVECPPPQPEWAGVWDRLTRAASPRTGDET